ncbi:MAG: DUF927 domain-containing protein, partial [Desulfobaccales bacterium]
MAQIKPNPSLARQFLKALYGQFFSQTQAAAFIEVRGKREGENLSFRRFYRTPEALVKEMADWPPAQHYWIGVALRKDNKGGAKVDLLALTTAFADVDVGAAGHKNAPKYQSKDEARAAVDQFPLRPSMLIDSGGGFQPYWLFREPVKLSPEMITRLETINRGLSLALKGDLPATDAARILRLPGTFNMKIAGQPRPVEIIWAEPERLYDLADFAPYEDQAQAHAQERRQGNQGPPGAPPGGDHAAYAQKALADELAKLARTPEGRRNTQLNESAFSLGQLIGAGALGRGEVEAGLSGRAAAIGLGETEARATIRSGIEAGLKEPRELPEKAAKRGNSPRQGKSPASPEQGKEAGQDEAEVERIGVAGHIYCVKDGRLCRAVYSGKEGAYDETKWEYHTLANFQARIEEEITRDDGSPETKKQFHLTGSLDTGRPLPPALVSVDKYEGMTWVKQFWGAWAAISPGTSIKSHVGNGIQAHSHGKTPKTPAFKQRTVYAHSGWRKIGGTWRYFHGGGAIGAGEPVEVDLGQNLGNYALPEPGGQEAAQASLRFIDVAPWEVTAPLLACCYLAPFSDLLKIDFSLWLYGPTGSFKSTLAALVLSHFGEFTWLNLPGSWLSTVNSLERLCFTLKDSLIVIDDFMPASSQKESHVMAERAARLIYQAGNRSGRGRLAPDLSARLNYYPRGLILATGEMLLPGQRQSATARYLGVELDPKKTQVDKEKLSVAQAEAHLYAGAMAAYLADLAPCLEETQEQLRALFEAYRGVFQGGGHARIPGIQSWLTVGFESAMNFFVRQGAISESQAHEMLNRAWKVFETLGEKHSRIIEGEKPTLKFLNILRESFLTSRVYAESKTSKGMPPPEKKEFLGWEEYKKASENAFLVGYADENMVYLLPETALRVVSDAIRAQGDFLSLGRTELWAALAREGIIAPG